LNGNRRILLGATLGGLAVAAWLVLRAGSDRTVVPPKEPVKTAERRPSPRPVAPAEAPSPTEAPGTPLTRQRGGLPVRAMDQAVAPVDVSVRTAFNFALQEAVNEARFRCLDDWFNEGGVDPDTTLVMDAVTQDGVVVDIAFRGAGEIPEHVVLCVKDVAWDLEWPELDLEGERRFQRSFNVR